MTFKQAVFLFFSLTLLITSLVAFFLDAVVFAMGAALAGFGFLGVTKYVAMKKQRQARLAKERADEVLPAFVSKESFNEWKYEKRREAKARKGLPNLVFLTSAIILGVFLLLFGTTSIGRNVLTLDLVTEVVSSIFVTT